MDTMPPTAVPENKADGKAKYTTISIPQPLYMEVKKHIEGTGFRSPTEFLVYVTRLSLAGQNATDLRPRPMFR
jgi:hypothetical protein